MKARKRILLSLVLVGLLLLPACGVIRDKIAKTRGELIGNRFNISVYDQYGDKTMEMSGSKISIDIFEDRKKTDESMPINSSVLEITANGKQMIQVGNTLVFAEDGLNMVEDYEIPEELQAGKGGSIVPFDRYINDIKNKLGEEKTIIVLTPLGVPIGVYQGKKVYVTVPDELPKMTRLNIDGKSLYIHRANYIIMDTDLLK